MGGTFIVFEGLDGSGLSTQAGMLRNWLQDKGVTAILTKEQTDGIIGGIIKSSLKKEWKTDPLALQMLFVADRANHLANEIEPALNNGNIVICDRYVLSTLAFGGIKCDVEFLKMFNSRFRKPDMTFIIDTPPEVCLQRIGKARFETELFEEKEKFTKVRDNYLSLKYHFPNTFVINGNRSKEDVFKDVRKIIEERLRL
ncbi:MAG: dTMP kinase [Candidatus Aenigmatarchaeota archaeon]